MYKSVDLDLVIKHVKNIYDTNSCSVCDKKNGKRMRYSCGHTSCDECAKLGNCSLCLTPPGTQSFPPVSDEPLTLRAANACRLLDTFQAYFNVDVSRKLRLSERLKAEKEVFPECIQAPSKYYNKRKSYQFLKANKENKPIKFPGQETSKIWQSKMDNSNENVHQWLNKYFKRKPFSELDPNQTLRSKKDKLLNTPVPTTPAKSAINENKSHNLNLKKDYSRNKGKRKHAIGNKVQITKKAKTGLKNANDESGIVIDDEAVIEIEDSQSINDKDMNALLAVQQAENNDTLQSQSIINPTFCKPSQNISKEFPSEVPFCKNSYIMDSCKCCGEDCNHKKNKDISITIDSKNYTTVITISHIDNHLNKHSVETQTDITYPNSVLKQNNTENVDDEVAAPLSQDLLKEYISDNKVMTSEKSGNVFIAESDSDEDLEASFSMEVKADVHRSCDERDYKILKHVEDMESHSKRFRRPPRGNTPTSTDSSDKENYNPNRLRKTRNDLKKKHKK